MARVSASTITRFQPYSRPNSFGSHPPFVEELMVPTELDPFGFSQKMMQYVMTCMAT